MPRSSLEHNADKGLATERWAGAVDTIGGKTLSGLFAEMASRSSVASCGMAGGPMITTAVWPFILRGVNLLGISSVKVTLAERKEIWRRLSLDLSLSLLDSMSHIEPLSRIHELGQQILDGQTRGRVVIDVARIAPSLRAGTLCTGWQSPPSRDWGYVASMSGNSASAK